MCRWHGEKSDICSCRSEIKVIGCLLLRHLLTYVLDRLDLDFFFKSSFWIIHREACRQQIIGIPKSPRVHSCRWNVRTLAESRKIQIQIQKPRRNRVLHHSLRSVDFFLPDVTKKMQPRHFSSDNTLYSYYDTYTWPLHRAGGVDLPHALPNFWGPPPNKLYPTHGHVCYEMQFLCPQSLSFGLFGLWPKHALWKSSLKGQTTKVTETTKSCFGGPI